MKQAVIVGHPNPNSFTVTIARACCDALRACGHEPVLRDLYAMGFDPLLKEEELPRAGGSRPGDDVIAERNFIAAADTFVFVYPLWFNAPPAIIKGYMDRIFSMGFGFGPIKSGANEPLLSGKQLLTFSASGAPSEWVIKEGAFAALRNLYDDHVAAACGLRVLDHVHFGSISALMTRAAVESRIAEVHETITRLFPKVSPRQ